MKKEKLHFIYLAIILILGGFYIFQIRPETMVGWSLGLEIAADFLTVVSAVIVAVAAVLGINTWRKQMRGQTEYELARRYLRSVYKVRDAIKSTRNPFIPVGEMVDSLKKQGSEEDDLNDNRKMNRAVYSNRWSKVVEAISDLSVELTEAEVVWGKEAVKLTKEIRDCTSKLMLNIKWFLDDKRQFSVEKLTEIDDVIYDRGEGDKFNEVLDKAVEAIEKYLENHLRR
ncbi:MAG: hypothetical protein Q7J45_02895 [bacterium]|nr:hypothetical protein [bacterium]